MIFNSFERMVAFRYLRARRAEGFVSVIAIFSLLGIALGVATLIIVMAVMNGFRADLIDRILGLNGHLGVYGPARVITDYDAMAAAIRQLPNVKEVTPLIQGQVMATSPSGGASPALVRGIRPDDIRHRKLIAEHISSGSLADFAGDSVAVGRRLAEEKLKLKVGDRITVIAPEGTDTAFGTVPRLKTYTIAALFDVGYYEYDSTFIYVPFEAAQVFFRVPNGASYLEVFATSAEQSSAVAGEIMVAFRGETRIEDWQQANSGIVNAVKVERDVMFLILTLIILVAAFNIISGMIMMVKDKGRDIAILRTMGASRGMILRIFILSGASIGIVGTLAGFVLGIVFTKNLEGIRHILESTLHVKVFDAALYFFTRIPARIETSEVATVVIMSLALSFLATLYPSWRAARLDPVEGLRYE